MTAAHWAKVKANPEMLEAKNARERQRWHKLSAEQKAESRKRNAESHKRRYQKLPKKPKKPKKPPKPRGKRALKNRTPENRVWRRKKYGFTPELFETRFAMRDGKCWVCGVELTEGRGITQACADHDHAANRPRGILCFRCNVALGLLDDSPAKIQGLKDYLALFES